MKKILCVMLTATLIMASCDDDDDNKVQTDLDLKLEKTSETIESEPDSLEIKASGDLSWKISKVILTDSINTEEEVGIETPTDSVMGDWFSIFKRENGNILQIAVDENNEKQRKLSIELITKADTALFDLTQNGVVEPE